MSHGPRVRYADQTTKMLRKWLAITVCTVVFVLTGAPAVAQSNLNEVHVAPRSEFVDRTAEPGWATHSKAFVSSVDLVLVPVSVTDAAGRVVSGLEKESFRVFDNKEQQLVKHFSCEDVPISLAVILDTSGSMEGFGKLENARAAVVEFLRMSNPEDEVLLISVADKPSLRTDFTTSIETIENALVLTTPKGSTALLDGIYLAVSELRNAKHGRKAVLIISDGGDNHSRYNEKEVKELVKESDVLIYAIGVYDSMFPTEEERLGPMLLADISELTGGRLFTLDNQQDLVDAAAKIGTELRNQYVLGYRPSSSPRDGKWHKLSVKLMPRKGLPRLQINARKGYYASSR